MAIELISCPACRRKNAADRTTCLSCGADLPVSNATEQKEVTSRWVATLWVRIKTRRLNGWQRLWVLLSAFWFLGWLVGFPLYVRSKDWRDGEFFVQWSRIDQHDTETLATRAPGWLRVSNWLHQNDSRLVRVAMEYEQLQSEIQRDSQLLHLGDKFKEAYGEKLDRIAQLYADLRTLPQNYAAFPNVYKRLLKSNWSGWGLYVLLGPLGVYAGVYGGIVAVRWVQRGFQNSSNV